MGIKINVGLAKKIGQPDYGSLGATCHVEFELDGGFDNGSTERFHDAVRRAYGACRQAVESEIALNEEKVNVGQHTVSPSRANRVSQVNGHVSEPNVDARGATASQVRAIHAIAKRTGSDLVGMLQSQSSVSRPDDLSLRDASALIDRLKGSGSVSLKTLTHEP